MRNEDARKSLPLKLPEDRADSQKRDELSMKVPDSIRTSMVHDTKKQPLESHECIIDGIPVQMVTDVNESKKIMKQIDSAYSSTKIL